MGREERRTEEENRPAWMGLACRRKGEGDMGEGMGVRAGRAVLERTARTAQDGRKKHSKTLGELTWRPQ